MNGERIQKLAKECAFDIFQPNSGRPEDVIEQAIRQALVEMLSEPATDQMQLVGYQAAANNHDQERYIYAAMCAEKRKEFEK